MKTSAVLCPPKACVDFQVRNFRLYGKLRKTDTEIHNSLPSIETIQTERSLTTFDEKRHSNPDNVSYEDFYRCLAPSVCHPPPPGSRLDTVRSSTVSSSSSVEPPVRHSTFTFTPAPFITQSARSTDSTCTQPLLPRLCTSVSLRSSQSSRQVDRASMLGSKSISSKSLCTL